MANFSFSGIDELLEDFDESARKVEKLAAKKHIAYSKVFNSTFMKKHTKFTSFKKMMETSGFDCSSQSKFDSIPKESLDQFIKSISRYKSFDNMYAAALEAYYKKELDF